MESKCIGVLWSVVVNTNLDAAPLSLDIQMASRCQSSKVLLDILVVICLSFIWRFMTEGKLYQLSIEKNNSKLVNTPES